MVIRVAPLRCGLKQNETGARRFGTLKGRKDMVKTVTKILGVVFLLVGGIMDKTAVVVSTPVESNK